MAGRVPDGEVELDPAVRVDVDHHQTGPAALRRLHAEGRALPDEVAVDVVVHGRGRHALLVGGRRLG
ncbi:MAG: hypothetical protein HOQ46_13580 [Saccharothrix sp.]|nr:hypothetical protein [Saccharothrix sp.]